MADWFKFYENDLDETRLQFAISKLPEVIPVWVGILSECCRHKSDTIRWGSDAIELFGFSRRLGISIPKVNEAVNILCEIDYISHSDNTINVLKWNNKQSEYCQKKKLRESKSVGTLSGQCPPRGEERRVDKKRGEGNAQQNGHTEVPAISPSQLKIQQERELERITTELKPMAPLSDYPKGSQSYNRKKELLERQKVLRLELGVVA